MPINYVPDYSGIGQGIGNLGTALFGNPKAVAQGRLIGQQGQNYEAEAAAHRAQAGLYGAQAQEVGDQNAAIKGLASIFSQNISVDPTSGSATIHNLPAVMGAVAAANKGKVDPKDWFSVNQIGTGQPDLMRQGLMMQGHMPNQNTATTMGESNAISARDAAEAQRLQDSKLHNVPPDNSVVSGASLGDMFGGGASIGPEGEPVGQPQGVGELFRGATKKPLNADPGSGPITKNINGVDYSFNSHTGAWTPTPGQKNGDYTITKVVPSYDPKLPPTTNVTTRVSTPRGASAPAPSSNEVTRVTADGKKAVFDATTKKFLRYAD